MQPLTKCLAPVVGRSPCHCSGSLRSGFAQHQCGDCLREPLTVECLRPLGPLSPGGDGQRTNKTQAVQTTETAARPVVSEELL